MSGRIILSAGRLIRVFMGVPERDTIASGSRFGAILHVYYSTRFDGVNAAMGGEERSSSSNRYTQRFSHRYLFAVLRDLKSKFYSD